MANVLYRCFIERLILDLDDIPHAREWIGRRGLLRLTSGTPRQRYAGRAVEEIGLFDFLGAFDPSVVGTFPIRVDIETSDVDVLCEVVDLDDFVTSLRGEFASFQGFRTWRREIDRLPTQVVLFQAGALPIEVFGQARPTYAQQGFLHLVVEARLLAIGGERARRAIRARKRRGQRTEEAFAGYFGFEGNPYAALAEAALLDDGSLRRTVESHTGRA